MADRIRTAIVGTGGIAKAHVRGYANLKDRAQIVAAMDIDPTRVAAFADEHKIPARYTDVAELLRKEKPQLVHICTPPGSHAKLSIQCMEGGAWVLCEKPLCASLAELDAIQDAERRTGMYTSSVFQWRFGSGGRHLKRLIEAGELGKPLVGICNTTWYRNHAYYEVPWRGKWSTELGGPTMGHGIHAMDLFFYLLGDFAEVRAMIDTLDRRIEVEDVSMALVKFKNGAMGSIVNSILCPREESYLRLDFQKATVELTHLYEYNNKHWRYTPLKEYEAELPRWQNIEGDINSNHGAQTAALLDDLAAGRRPLVSGNEARRTIELLTCIYKSAMTGEPVKQGSIQKGDPFYEHVGGTAALKSMRA
jgi:predicted dehydrogenase